MANHNGEEQWETVSPVSDSQEETTHKAMSRTSHSLDQPKRSSLPSAVPPAFLPPRPPYLSTSRRSSRFPGSLHQLETSFPKVAVDMSHGSTGRTANDQAGHINTDSTLPRPNSVPDILLQQHLPRLTVRPLPYRKTSLQYDRSRTECSLLRPALLHAATTDMSHRVAPQLCLPSPDGSTPASTLHSQSRDVSQSNSPIEAVNYWPSPPFPLLQVSTATQPPSGQVKTTSRPSPTFKCLSSLDNLLSYREEKAEWKRTSSQLQRHLSEPTFYEKDLQSESNSPIRDSTFSDFPDHEDIWRATSFDEKTLSKTSRHHRFRHAAAEVGFCFTIAMTQFLAEYLISGFAIVLPSLLVDSSSAEASTTGTFWPAALLTLILSASLLIFARISDMHGGYLPFMFGLVWLTIWTLIPGLSSNLILLDVSRAMQGLAIAAFMPSTFTMIGGIYAEGRRKNVVLGLYGACAPLGFYAGFLAGGALPLEDSRWYFWIAAAFAFITGVIGYLSVPHDRTDRKQLGLKMDWLGAFFITSGLILVAYALSVEPYVNQIDPSRSGFTYPMVLAPLSTGIVCLAVAVWVEGWHADCPLLSFDFFKPRGVKSFCLACLFFYGTFGVWIYNSSEYFELGEVNSSGTPTTGIMLALWYTPMALGGFAFCVIGGTVANVVPTKVLLLISGAAWVGAPLIFALGPLPLNYWYEILPSMICATLGTDLTFTISNVFLSSSQPLRYQGVAGAVSSILVNLGMSLSLPISAIVNNAAKQKYRSSRHTGYTAEDAAVWGYRATFIFAAVSAALGVMVCVVFFHSRPRRSLSDELDVGRRMTTSSEVTTLVDEQV